MHKHAYIIVANANFKVLKKCLELIDDIRNDVFLLLDKKARVSEEIKKQLRQMCSRSSIYIMEKIVNWGGTHKLMLF